MPAKDVFHDSVKNALTNEDWVITKEHYYFRIGQDPVYIDLAAEKMIAAEKGGRKIAVEIKSFAGASLTADFHVAVGQFVNYRIALRSHEPERTLYLAIPIEVYKTYFARQFATMVVEDQNIKLLIYDPEQEVILQWID
ncbi:MAG: element excision factor XisH family protein [Caldilineaceae bacterium]